MEPLTASLLARIAGRERLIQHLGNWPSFHDFEVLAITLERPIMIGATCDLRATFLVFDVSKSQEDPERRQGTADMLFEDINDLHIDGFNHQNPIIGLSILPGAAGADLFHVAWGGSCLCHEVSFTCHQMSVLRVVDLNPFRRAAPYL